MPLLHVLSHQIMLGICKAVLDGVKTGDEVKKPLQMKDFDEYLYLKETEKIGVGFCRLTITILAFLRPVASLTLILLRCFFSIIIPHFSQPFIIGNLLRFYHNHHLKYYQTNKKNLTEN